MDESLGKWRPIETSATDEANSWKGSSYSGEIKPSADRGWVKQEKAETLRLRNELAEMRRMNAALIHSGLAVGTEAAVLRTHNELLESDLTALRERMAVADAKLSRLSQLADSWSDRGGYAKGVFAKDLRNVLAGTVGGGPQVSGGG